MVTAISLPNRYAIFAQVETDFANVHDVASVAKTERWKGIPKVCNKGKA